MNNKQKNEKYKELMYKLKKALNNEFYYEAIFIEYAVFEDRTESLLKHANLSFVNNKNEVINLNGKLKKIENSAIFYRDKYVAKHINKKMLSEIHEWKNKRNKLIHDLIKTEYTNDDVKNIALEGYEMIRRINNKSTLVNKYLDSKIEN